MKKLFLAALCLGMYLITYCPENEQQTRVKAEAEKQKAVDAKERLETERKKFEEEKKRLEEEKTRLEEKNVNKNAVESLKNKQDLERINKNIETSNTAIDKTNKDIAAFDQVLSVDPEEVQRKNEQIERELNVLNDDPSNNGSDEDANEKRIDAQRTLNEIERKNESLKEEGGGTVLEKKQLLQESLKTLTPLLADFSGDSNAKTLIRDIRETVMQLGDALYQDIKRNSFNFEDNPRKTAEFSAEKAQELIDAM